VNAHVDATSRNTVPTAVDPLARREDTMSGIVRSLSRVPNGKLSGVERLVNSPTGRVFTPRSSYGFLLFNRLVTVDAVYGRCEQQVIRRASSLETFDDKVALERRMFELNAFLIEFVADMALTLKVEDAVRDPAIEEAIRRLKAERESSAQPGKAARAGRASRDRAPVAPDPEVAGNDAAALAPVTSAAE